MRFVFHSITCTVYVVYLVSSHCLPASVNARSTRKGVMVLLILAVA